MNLEQRKVNDKAMIAFLDWIKREHKGECDTNKLLDFKKRYPRYLKQKAKIFCSINHEYLQYIHGTKEFPFARIKVLNYEYRSSDAPRDSVVRVEDPNVGCQRIWINKANIPQRLIEEALNKNIDFSQQFRWTTELAPLMRERVKAISYEAKEELYKEENNEKRLELLRSNTPLNVLSKDLNITTTQLGKLLAGSLYIEHLQGKEQVVDKEDPDYEHRIRRAQETIDLAGDDLFNGTEIGNSINLERTLIKGKAGESILEKQLQELGIARDLFLTEEDQKDLRSIDSRDPTPDILFKQPITLFDQQIHWIEVKNALIIPFLSPKNLVERLHFQITNYTEKFGSGAIFWASKGFSESIITYLPSNVIHFRSKENKSPSPTVPQARGSKGTFAAPKPASFRPSRAINVFSPNYSLVDTFGDLFIQESLSRTKRNVVSSGYHDIFSINPSSHSIIGGNVHQRNYRFAGPGHKLGGDENVSESDNVIIFDCLENPQEIKENSHSFDALTSVSLQILGKYFPSLQINQVIESLPVSNNDNKIYSMKITYHSMNKILKLSSSQTIGHLYQEIFQQFNLPNIVAISLKARMNMIPPKDLLNITRPLHELSQIDGMALTIEEH